MRAIGPTHPEFEKYARKYGIIRSGGGFDENCLVEVPRIVRLGDPAFDIFIENQEDFIYDIWVKVPEEGNEED